jgi:hypothetical protein
VRRLSHIDRRPARKRPWRTGWSRSATSLARLGGDWRGVRAAITHPGGSTGATAAEGLTISAVSPSAGRLSCDPSAGIAACFALVVFGQSGYRRVVGGPVEGRAFHRHRGRTWQLAAVSLVITAVLSQLAWSKGQPARAGLHELRGRGLVRLWPRQAAAGNLDLCPRPALVEVSRSVLARPSGGEKVGEQLGDALSRVVMHPVRRAEQALDAVQVGHVVVVGLG